jgi:hypothetical protein
METQLDPIEPKTARERELRDRAVRDYSALQAVGLETGRTFYPPGTEADIALKSGRISQARRVFTDLPDAKEGLSTLADTVLAEDRQDTPVRFGGFTSDASEGNPHIVPTISGGFVVLNNGDYTNELRVAPTERACQSIVAHRPADHPAPALDINTWRFDIAPAKELVLRHRKLPEHRQRAYAHDYREAYAVVSPSYKPYDLDAAANDLASIVPAGSRTRIRYDGARATVDVVLQNPYRLADGSGDAAAVGETHRVVLRMKTADDGSSGYHLQLLAERVRCVNLTLLHAKKRLFSGTHRQDNLRDLAQEALAAVEPTMAEFAKTWEAGWQEYYADKYTGKVGGEEAVRRLVSWGKFRIPGLGQEGTLDAVLQALAEEPGDSKLHVHNALTRAAHASPVTWATRWADDTAEEQASQLLYQNVRWLPEVPEVLS